MLLWYPVPQDRNQSKSKVRSDNPNIRSQNLWCHHKEKIWKLDDSCCIFINHVYEILQFFFSWILSDRSNMNTKIFFFCNKTSLVFSPQQISKELGWQDPVPVGHPVEVVQEEPDRALGDKLRHDLITNHSPCSITCFFHHCNMYVREKTDFH